MAPRNDFPDFLGDLKHQFGFFDDFLWYISPHMWTALAADSTATVTIDADGVGGIVAIFTDTTDNNEAALVTTNELFKLAAGKPFRAGARIQFTELTGNGANVFFGFANAMAANVIADGGAGVDSSYTDVVGIWKGDGDTVWSTHAENGSDAETGTSGAAAGGASYQELEIFGNVIDGSIDEYEITFKVDNVPLYDSNGRIITHRISYASATEMDFGVYAKTGVSGEALTVNVDWVYAVQQR